MFDNRNDDTFIDNCVKLNGNNFMTITRSNKNILLFNCNIRSHHRNSDVFFGIIQQFGTMPDIFCLTETWFTEQTLGRQSFCLQTSWCRQHIKPFETEWILTCSCQKFYKKSFGRMCYMQKNK